LVIRLLRHQYGRELSYCTPEEGTIVSKHVACTYCDRSAEHGRVSHRNADGRHADVSEGRADFVATKHQMATYSFSNGDQGNFVLGGGRGEAPAIT